MFRLESETKEINGLWESLPAGAVFVGSNPDLASAPVEEWIIFEGDTFEDYEGEWRKDWTIPTPSSYWDRWHRYSDNTMPIPTLKDYSEEDLKHWYSAWYMMAFHPKTHQWAYLPAVIGWHNKEESIADFLRKEEESVKWEAVETAAFHEAVSQKFRNSSRRR